MGDSTFLQQDFRGGKWSPYYQGQIENPDYRKSMNVALNVLPTEEGAATRRPGFRYIAATRGGQPAAIRRFAFAASLPYDIEFTAGHMRFTSGNNLVLEPTTQNVTSISGADPAAVGTAGAHNWSTGDEVQFALPVNNHDVGAHLLFNRQFLITVTGADSFTIADSVTGAPVNGASITLGPAGLLVSRVLDFATPYTLADLPGIRTIQGSDDGEEFVIILSQAHQPQILTAPTNPDAAFNSFATFALGPCTFIDGPYYDPVNDGGVLTSSALTGVVTITLAYQSWSSTTTYGIGDTVVSGGIGYVSLIDSNLDNTPASDTSAWQAISPGQSVGINGFVATDLGRSMRLFSQPPAWNKATAYAIGDSVDFGGEYWTALVANTNQQPGLLLTNWAINPSAAAWTWGRIQSVVSATSVTLQLLGGPLLYSTASSPVEAWQMGRYSNTTGWPTCGVYYEGRLWLAAMQFPDHIDASMSNETFQFSPSGPDGTVDDNDGISENLNDDEANAIFWMIPDGQGIVLGTLGGEFLVQASQLSDPLTPSSFQCHKITKYGMENVEPRRTGITFITVQRFARKMLEYYLNVYSNKYEALNLAERARDVTTNGIAEMAYQLERTPLVWIRDTAGNLASMSYKRERSFQSTGPTFWGWAQHALGGGRQITGIQAGPSFDGLTDSVTIVSWDGVNQNGHWLEILTPVFDEEQSVISDWFVDEGDVPWAVVLSGDDILLYGYYYLAGQTVQVVIGGIDCGNFVVSADGVITVPLGSGFTSAEQGLLTTGYLAELTAEASSFTSLAQFVSNGNSTAQGEPSVTGLGEYFTGTYNYSTGGIANGAVDWVGNLLYVAGANGATAGGTVYNVSTMAPVASASDTAIFGTTGTDDSFSTGCVGADGMMYFYASGAQNSGRAAAVNSGLVLQRSFGAHSGNGYSSDGGIALPASMCAVSCLNQYIVQTSVLSGAALSGGTGTELAVWDGTNMKFVAAYGADQPQGAVCAGRQTNDGMGHYYGEAFAIVNDYNKFLQGAYIDTNWNTPLSLWRVSINLNPPSTTPEVSFTNVASIAPSAIDATWSWWSAGPLGICFDPTDGNVIAVFTGNGQPVNWVYSGNNWTPGYVVLGSNGHAYLCIGLVGNVDPTVDAGVHWTDLGAYSAPTHGHYIAKINSATGAVMWALPVAGDLTWESWGQSDLANGLLAYHDSATTVRWINTVAGSLVTETFQNVTPQGQQFWGPTGLITAVNYSDTGGAPTPVPVAPCTTTFTNHWGLFEAVPAVAANYTIPIVAGYTYTTQGQVLRPVIPQETQSQVGPSLGVERRVSDIAILFQGASTVYIGTDFNHLFKCNFLLAGPKGAQEVACNPIQLYSDVYRDSVDDDYSFNGQPCWQVTRPYPCTVCAIEAMMETSGYPDG